MDGVAARLREGAGRWARHAVPADGAPAWLVMLAVLDVAVLVAWSADPAPVATLAATVGLGTLAFDATVWMLSGED
jgi:hypothetical protein